ncbi:gliding motility-associated C-terminal domain-containing protein [Flavobacterium sp.]|uniref:gliding motility-associated C-terminal domain-containing protein n=1 Tax=Flavobacterium sp. TaxID=239 RepID=UPI00262D6AEB|nr:gliding motility-associated C-terminal domain-containing protein [Flavobacterium sp.]
MPVPPRSSLGILISAFFTLFFLAPGNSHAQCAGVDATIEICNYGDSANQSINLFDLLGPTAVPGGTWSDPSFSGGLNQTTGVLNAWNIHYSGVYVFTYTVAPSPGCPDNTAEVSVTVAGYVGVTSPNGSACSDDDNVNLFQFFDGSSPNPQFDGVWLDNDNTGAVTPDGIFNATMPGVGTYSFTYTMSAIGSCPAPAPVTAVVTVYRAPVPGTPVPLILCEDADFSLYTNLNLFDQLSGEDANGRWSEGDSGSTGQISGPFDSVINLQEVFNTYGPGKYQYKYTVFPENPVCTRKIATIDIIIEEILDFTGATLTVNSDICEDEIATASYSVVLTPGNEPKPYSDYSVDYHVTGPTTFDGTATVEDAFYGATGNVLTFPLDAALFQDIGTYTISIDHIIDLKSYNVCDNIIDVSDELHIYPNPKLTGATLSIPQSCLGFDANVVVTGNPVYLPDGNYQFTYSLTGNNIANGETITAAIVNGVAHFSIPASLLAVSGSTTLLITNVINLQTNCASTASLSKAFNVNQLPNVSAITINAADACIGQSALISLTGLNTMTSIGVTYQLGGANVTTVQTANFTASSGQGSFTIPASFLLNTGSTGITILSIKDLVTGCAVDASITDSFIVHPLPDVSSLSAIVPNVCTGQTVSVLLSGLGGITTFRIAYSISGANTFTGQSATLTASSGAAVFNIPAAQAANTGTSTFTITSLTDTQTGCPAPTNIPVNFSINPVPVVSNFNVIVPNVCAGEPLAVLLANLGTANSMTLTYNLSGINSATNQTQTVTVSAGSATFVIPQALVPNTGNTIITIINATNNDTGCSATGNIQKSFNINPLPDITTLTASVADACMGDQVVASVSGLGNLSTVSITYSLSGANSAANQTAIVPVNAGIAAFIIPTAILSNSGDSTLSITNILNSQTVCGANVTTVGANFKINARPVAPTAENAVFCSQETPSVSMLVPFGNQYHWYGSATNTDELPGETVLTGGNYYVSEMSNLGCESPRTMVMVSIAAIEPPVLNTDGALFCGADKPTLLDLTTNVSATDEVRWYDAPQDGNLLAQDLLLQEGETYYGVQFSESVGCESSEVLEVTVSLTDCNENPSQYDFFIPDGFSPNGDSVNDTFRIPDIEFLYPDYSYEIYNRYGNILFRGNINKPAWDGTDNESGGGKIAPNGVYFYVIKFNKNNASSRQGRLYLNR